MSKGATGGAEFQDKRGCQMLSRSKSATGEARSQDRKGL